MFIIYTTGLLKCAYVVITVALEMLMNDEIPIIHAVIIITLTTFCNKAPKSTIGNYFLTTYNNCLLQTILYRGIDISALDRCSK